MVKIMIPRNRFNSLNFNTLPFNKDHKDLFEQVLCDSEFKLKESRLLNILLNVQQNKTLLKENVKNSSPKLKKIFKLKRTSSSNFSQSSKKKVKDEFNQQENLIGKEDNFLNLLRKFFFGQIINSESFEKFSKVDIFRMKEFLFLKEFSYSQINQINIDKIFKGNLDFMIKNYLNQFFSDKKLNYFRKVFKMIQNKMRLNLIPDRKLCFSKKGYEIFIAHYFNVTKPETVKMIRCRLFEFKKKGSLFLFSFRNFKEVFKKYLMKLQEQNWKQFVICYTKFFRNKYYYNAIDKKIHFTMMSLLFFPQVVKYFNNIFNH